eukprot:5573208-Pleurochrysis_carterae.AAC.2
MRLASADGGGRGAECSCAAASNEGKRGKLMASAPAGGGGGGRSRLQPSGSSTQTCLYRHSPNQSLVARHIESATIFDHLLDAQVLSIVHDQVIRQIKGPGRCHLGSVASLYATNTAVQSVAVLHNGRLASTANACARCARIMSSAPPRTRKGQQAGRRAASACAHYACSCGRPALPRTRAVQ